MAKLKEPLSSKKGKNKLGKIDKVKKSTDAFQMKKLQVKLPTSSAQKKGPATPFAKKPLTTSTPFHFDNKNPTNVNRFPLSPILSNTSNINRMTTNNHRESAKNNVVVDKENLPKRTSLDLEATNETVDFKFRVGTRKKLPLTSNDERKQPRVRLPRLGTPSITISSELDSSREMSKIDRSTLSSSSMLSDKSVNRASQKKSGRNSLYLLKRLQSDWSSMLGESPTVATKPNNTRVRTRSTRDFDSGSDGSELYRQNKCSELRVRSRRSTIDATTSEARRNQRSPKDNTLINKLRGDWTNLTIDSTPDSNRNKLVSQNNAKRILQPLYESITEEKVIARGSQRVESMNKKKKIEDLIEEDEYSSSAEFQSDDEMNSLSRSKRAPTWGELLNKKNENTLNESLGKRKRSPKTQLKTMHNMSLSKRAPSWGDLLDKTNEKSSTESVCQRSRTLRIQLKRMHHIESPLSPEQQESEKSKKKNNLVEEEEKLKKNGKLNEDVEVKKVQQETTLRRSRRLSVKNVDISLEQCLEEVPEPPKGKRKRTPKATSKQRNLEEVNDVNQAKKLKTVQENKPRRSRRNSTKDGIEIDASPDQKTVQRTTQKSSNHAKNRSNDSNKFNPVDNKNKIARKSEDKKRDSVVECEVSKNSSAEEVHQERMEISGLDVNASEQQTQQRKSNSTEKSTSPLQHHDTEKNISIDLTHPVKFFHSRLERTHCPPKQPQTKISKSRNRSSKRNKKDSVYEFLSQSSSDSNHPVDDVIMKMIKSGKVVVAKHKKGTGKNVLPHTRPDRNRKKKTKTNQIPAKTTQPPIIAKPPLQEKIPENDDAAPEFDHDDFHFNNNDNNFETPHEEHDDQVRDQRGFSNLARSTMVKQAQAGRIQKRKPIKDKKKLLEMAMKFVSQSVGVTTPQHQPMKSPNFSPTPIGAKSPWRVDDDKLPTAFYLGRNTQNLPSFSSDHIPMTPVKNKSKSMSSFSSNDSNGENKAPSGANTITNQANYKSLANARKNLTYRSPLKAINIVDVVTLPPLAMHSYGNESKDKGQEMNNNSKEVSVRSSPQKSARNLFDNFSNHSSNNSKSGDSNENIENQLQNTVGQNTIKMRSFGSDNSLTTTNKRHSGSDISLNTTNKRHSGSDVSQSTTNKRHSGSDVSLRTYSRRSGSNASTNNNNNSITNLFGFEDFIGDDNDSPNFIVDKTILPNKDALKERLQRLKKLRPNKPAIPPSSSNKLTLNRIKPVFDQVQPVQQRSIKQMLCSTMIGNDNPDMNNRCLDESQDLSNLFKDPDPETTFDDSLPRRTYKRPHKKKRKMYSQYAMFLESDVSDDEEEEEHQKTVKTYKPKSKKREKNNPDLKKFVNEFNEMCKEISQYELIVE